MEDASTRFSCLVMSCKLAGQLLPLSQGLGLRKFRKRSIYVQSGPKVKELFGFEKALAQEEARKAGVKADEQ